MKKKGISLLMVVVMIFGLITFTPTILGRQVLAAGENFIIVGDNTTPTNKDVVLDIELTDNTGGSGIDKIILPDGSTKTETKLTYTITQNGNYTFKVLDKAGNETTGTLEVKNIFKEAPTMTLVASTTSKTNKDVIITATATSKGTGNAIRGIILPGDTKVKEGTKQEFTVSANGTYEFTAVDLAGNTVKQSIEVTNINKVKPVITVESYATAWTNQDVIVKVTTDKGTLNATSHTFTENGSFKFVATDEWGNITEETVNIGHIDKVPPTIKITIQP